MTSHASKDTERALIERVLRDEAAAVTSAIDALGPEVHEAVDLMAGAADAGGTVLVSGLGKSGLIGAKISATLASLGVPSHPVHPTEAAHGDLGRFRAADVAICISNSGETDELVNLASILRQDDIAVISITGEPTSGEPSSLARLARVALRLDIGDEAGGMVAPTTSTTVALAVGDALAIAAAHRRNDTDAAFARRHPGGALGNRLRPVADLLRFRIGENMTPIRDDSSVHDALARAEVKGRRPGAIILVSPDTGKLSGIFTDGDLRRLVLRGSDDEMHAPIATVMTEDPRALPATALVRDALLMIREHRQDEIPVVNDDGKPVGLLDVQDLVAMRLVRDHP